LKLKIALNYIIFNGGNLQTEKDSITLLE